ncbi:MAG TPA: SGNH/GDSL hydrolase family protein [Leptolyngbya sp.]|jgi:phospholipase/lecithinase/hemolysin|nr:SGNH/GDSL hydrolase family protein [Leptolyngbya sp.]
MRQACPFPKKAIFLMATFILVAIAIIMIQSKSHPPKQPSSVLPIDQLYIFGDSLSDVGNVFRATGGNTPSEPYFEGRYSNGRVWVEELAAKLNLSKRQVKNFAWGGATTGERGENQVPGVLAQVEAFVKSQPNVDPPALFVVWAGANDYLSRSTTPTAAIENITEAIQVLSKVGAERFLIANLPNLGRLPATRNTNAAQKLTNMVLTYNQKLQTTLDRLRTPDRTIAELDVFTIYNTAIHDPQQFGFRNVTNACLGSSANCDRYLFWDGIHPTTAAHKVLGDFAFKQVEMAIQR